MVGKDMKLSRYYPTIALGGNEEDSEKPQSV
jgi:hypothetical protein